MAGLTANNWWGVADPQTIPTTMPMDPSVLNTVGSAPAFSASQPGSWDSFSGLLGDIFNKKSMFGGTDLSNNMRSTGWVAPALGVAQGLASSYLGYKQYQLAKDTLNQNKRQFDINFGAQQKTTNAALADRQAARVAANPSGYQSVGDYMKQYGI